MTYDATLTIDSAELASTWDGSNAVALADISIVWGRDDLYEETPPTAFTVYLIDPTGLWATDNALSGKVVKIARGDTGKIILRGTIADITAERRKAQHPVTGKTVVVWLVALSGRCKQADLDQAYLVGPGAYQKARTLYSSDPDYPNEGPWNEPERQAGWWPGPRRSEVRLASLLAGGLSDYVAGVDVPSTIEEALGYPDAHLTYMAEMSARSVTDRSALGHLRDMFRAYPLGHVNYNSDTNRIQLGTTAQTGGLKLTLAAGLIVASPVAGLTIDSGTVIVPEDATVKSTVAYAIDTVAVPYEIRDLAHVTVGGGSVSAPTLRAVGGSPTDRVLVVDPGFWIMTGAYTTNSPTSRTGILFGQALANLTRDLVDDVNGMFILPTLQFDLRRFTYPPALVDLILDSMDHPVPLYFAGSMFADLANIPAQHQIIGGTLRWIGRTEGGTLPAGWVLDAITAPATGTVDPETLAGLVTNMTPTLEDFHPSITLDDLDNVTIGLD